MGLSKSFVGRYLDHRTGLWLPYDLGDPFGDLLSFSKATFTRSGSPAYCLDSLNSRILGPFAGDELAYTIYQGRKYAQIEEARTNVFTRSQELDHADWNASELAVTAQADPLSGSTAYKLAPTSVPGTHYIRQSITPDGSSDYIMYAIAKAAGYDWMCLQIGDPGFVNDTYSYYNVANGTLGATEGAGVQARGILALSNGYYLCWMRGTSDAAAASDCHIYVGEGDGDITITGNSVDGINVWNPQCEKGVFPSSPIKTEANPVTRDKDQLYWSAAVVPETIRSGKWAFDVVPYWEYDEKYGDASLFTFNSTQWWENGISWGSGAKKLWVTEDGVYLFSSNSLTFSRGQRLTIELDAEEGSIEVFGATSGNGKIVGTSWTWPDDESLWCGSGKGEGNFADALIREPYRP